MRLKFVAAALLALAACGKKPDQGEAASNAAAPSAVETTEIAPAETPSDARAYWAELQGVWAETGRCGDDLTRWIIEADAFHLYEMHCAVEKLTAIPGGVRASAECAIEGDNDGAPDHFAFQRQADGSLSIVQEANNAMTPGLFLCDGGETEL
jgi:hypothetical protein